MVGTITIATGGAVVIPDKSLAAFSPPKIFGMAPVTEDALFRSIEGMQKAANKPWWVSALEHSLLL